jgi:hypothetical protein
MRAAATMASPRTSPPGPEAAVAGDDDRAAFVAAGDEREQQVGGLALQGEVADLVDDEQPVEVQASQLVVEAVAVLGAFEAVDPLLGGGEQGAVAGLAGLDGQRGREEASMSVKSSVR